MTPVAVAAVALACVSAARAIVVIDTVPVGNPANPSGQTGYGGVDYTYNIGKYEVTTVQYTEFLNAVAATDTYAVYNAYMWVDFYGCQIERTGSPGSYSYSVAPDQADRPVNYVSWGDAARFANWLHNGQPTGAQGLSTTEDGSYFLNGATSSADLLAVTREVDATWVIPLEDEWYKAAYHKNDGVTGNYWYYPMGSNAVPDNGLPAGDTGNTANIYDVAAGGYAIGSPYYRNEVGYFGLSDSPYGTFDQAGNVWEWNETVIGSNYGLRGGCWNTYHGFTHAAYRQDGLPEGHSFLVGFRVAEVAAPPAPCVGDCNGDDLVDLVDFAAFAGCLTNPNVPYAARCQCADLDGDGDVDINDFAIFQTIFDLVCP